MMKIHAFTQKYSLLVFCLFILFSQKSGAEALKEHTKLWTAVQLDGPLSGNHKWRYYLEPQLRFIDDTYKFQHLNLYFAGLYQSTQYLSFWLGGFRGFERTSEGGAENEVRLWEQIVWTMVDSPCFKGSSRSRLEERKRLSEAQIANRFREKLSFKFAIPRYERTYLVLTDEVFLQLNQPQWVVDRVFAQNRAAIGIEMPVNKNTNYEIGYLNQFEYGTPNQMSNILYANVYVSID